VESAPLQEVYQASEAALRDMDMEVQKREQRALDAVLSAEEADGTNIKVDLEKLNDNSTRVAIKVGTFGDDDIARMVLDKIRANLGVTAAQRPETNVRTTPAGFREKPNDDEIWLTQPSDKSPNDDMQNQPRHND
jgi:hypothetical protein